MQSLTQAWREASTCGLHHKRCSSTFKTSVLARKVLRAGLSEASAHGDHGDRCLQQRARAPGRSCQAHPFCAQHRAQHTFAQRSSSITQQASPSCRVARFAAAGQIKCQVVQATAQSYPASRYDEGWTPLHHAAFADDAAQVSAMLSAGANAAAEGPNGVTPLHIAVQIGSLAVVANLLQWGAPVTFDTTTGCKGWSPLHCAADNCEPDMLHLLLSHATQVDLNATNLQGWSPLHIAVCQKEHIQDWMNQNPGEVFEVHQCHYDQMQDYAPGDWILNRAQYQEQALTLYDIVDKRQVQCVRLLLEYGASICQTTIQGCTPLHCAIAGRSLDTAGSSTVTTILDSQREASTIAFQSYMHCVQLQNADTWLNNYIADLLHLLIKHGAAVASPDNMGATATLPYNAKYVIGALSALSDKLEMHVKQAKDKLHGEVQPVIGNAVGLAQLRKDWPQQQQELMQTVDAWHQEFVDAESNMYKQSFLYLQNLQACHKALAVLVRDNQHLYHVSHFDH